MHDVGAHAADAPASGAPDTVRPEVGARDAGARDPEGVPDGRVVLVAGASSGVGAAIGRAVARRGGRVALAARRADLLAAVAAECGGDPCALAVPADLTLEGDAGRAVALTVARFGHLDAVVLNAAVGLVGPIEHVSLDDWRRTLDVNLTGAFLVARAAIPHLRATRGALVAIGSEFSRAGFSGLGAYAASKWALLGLMRCLALELAPDGIRVSSVLPAGILTDFGSDTVEQKRERQARGERFLRPEEVADAVCYLLAQPPSVWTEELDLRAR